MKLSASQLREFDENGYLFLPDCFSSEETTVLRRAATEVYALDR